MNQVRKKILKYLLILMLGILLAPQMTTYATVEVNVGGNTSTTTGGSNPGGASYQKTAWLFYIVDSSGNTVSGTDAQVWKISGNVAIPTDTDYEDFTPSLGDASVTWTSKTAEFSRPFYSETVNDKIITTSYYEDILAWMKETDSNDVSKAWNFIKGLWGEDVAEDWIQEDYHLILELLVWHNIGYRYSSTHSTTYNGTDLVFGTLRYMADCTKTYLSALNLPYSVTSTSAIIFDNGHYSNAIYLSDSVGDLSGCKNTNLIDTNSAKYLTYSQIQNYGFGMMSVTASNLGIEKEPKIEGDSYFYSLSSVGNSYPSGTSSTGGTSSSSSIIGASSTSGSDGINTSNTNPYALLKASFSAGSGATGTAPYALALSLKDNLNCSSYSNSGIPTGSTFSFAM